MPSTVRSPGTSTSSKTTPLRRPPLDCPVRPPRAVALKPRITSATCVDARALAARMGIVVLATLRRGDASVQTHQCERLLALRCALPLAHQAPTGKFGQQSRRGRRRASRRPVDGHRRAHASLVAVQRRRISGMTPPGMLGEARHRRLVKPLLSRTWNIQPRRLGSMAPRSA